MKTDEIFNTIYQDIKEYHKEGKIIKVFSGNENPSVVSVSDLCNQSIYGLLYDLDLDEAQLMTIHKENPLEFANQMAVVSVIRYLYKLVNNSNK